MSQTKHKKTPSAASSNRPSHKAQLATTARFQKFPRSYRQSIQYCAIHVSFSYIIKFTFYICMYLQ